MDTDGLVSCVDLGEDLTPIQMSAWLGLLETHSALMRQLDAMLRSSHQLGLSAYEILLRLGRAPACRLRMTELAASGPLTLSGVSRLVDRLERDGMVKREGCAEDGRVAHATLTQAGGVRLRAAHKTYSDGVRRLFLEYVSAQELDILKGIWRRLGAQALGG